MLAQRDEQVLDAVAFEKLAGAFAQVVEEGGGVGRGAQAGSLIEFLEVGLDHGSPGILAVVASLGVDDDRFSGITAGLDDALTASGGQEALCVVGKQNDIGGQYAFVEPGFEDGFRFGHVVETAFVVDAQKVAVAGDDACLLDGGVAGNLDTERVPAYGVELAADLSPGAVVADKADEIGLTAQRVQIGHHVACPAEHTFLTAVIEYRDGSFRRNAFDLAVEEMIEHDVAYAEHADILVRFDYRGKKHDLLEKKI